MGTCQLRGTDTMSPPVRTAIISDSLLVVGKMTALDQQTNAQPRPWQARASRPPLLV